MNKIKFKNGSYIIGVDLANDNKIVRGNRSKIIMVNSKYMQQQNKKWIREQFKIMKLKWHQKLRIELDYLWDDIKLFTRRKYRSIIKLVSKLKFKGE